MTERGVTVEAVDARHGKSADWDKQHEPQERKKERRKERKKERKERKKVHLKLDSLRST